ncbi:cation:dicarboxylase symporter family transporter [Aquabacter sp. CN5-332]|uniref:cation:dicarboxylate symporter family transporter n=1 Tax=Aquabacter sp. CN5-332 TaxID=3156608 RepID=UPI0032B518FE
MPHLVLTGVVLGILTGLVFGERAVVLAPVGSAYTMLLEIAIYPYLVCSVLQGLGRLAPGRAMRFFQASWPPFLAACLLALSSAWLLAQAMPPTPPPLVLDPAKDAATQDLLALLIPANPIAALLNNRVPAVVVFAVLYGIAVQGAPRRQTFLDVLETVSKASVTIWNWIVKLSPIGVFALLANTAGTLRPSEVGGFLTYNLLFLSGTIILALVVLPLAVTALAPVTWRDYLKAMQPGLVLALVTTLPVMALPAIQRAAEKIAAQAGCPEGEENEDVLKAAVALSYVFAQVGNQFCNLLIYYAALLAHRPLDLVEHLLLPLLSLLSCVGTPSTTIGAVSFLSSWLGLPPGTTDLWVETSALTRYGQVLLSVSALGFVSILVPLIYWGRWRLRSRRGLLALGSWVILLGLVVGMIVALRPALFPLSDHNRLTALSLDPALTRGVEATVLRQAAAFSSVLDTPPTVPAIRASGVLRVGYNPNVMPFSYFNARGELVGYDISLVYRLARDLNVKLEFIPFTWDGLETDLVAHKFDLAISGIYVTDSRFARITPGPTYLSSPPALIVRTDAAQSFTSRAAVNARPNLRLAVFRSDEMTALARQLFPNATITMVETYADLEAVGARVDGALWTLDQARAWAELHQGWTAVVPRDVGAPLPMAIMLPPDAALFKAYLDTWMSLQLEDGFADAQRAYWLEGKPRMQSPSRWNLIDALSGSGNSQDR